MPNPTVVEINTLRQKADQPLIRFNLRRYSDQDIADLREAFEAFYEISDTAPGDVRGFWATARGHGYDQDLCHTDPRLFLTWHRAYVYVFEKALSAALRAKRGDDDLVITLPYWDWTVYDPDTDAANGLPKAIDDAEYTTADGETRRNPLAAARSLYRIASQGLSGDEEYTQRFPTQLRRGIPQLASWVYGYYDEPDYVTFNSDFDGGAHGAVHVWVGGRDASSPLPRNAGDMSSVVSAAFDPVFWLHHCMVDRVWFRWQRLHGNSTVPDHVLESTTYGGFTGEQVLAAEEFLRYTYSDAPVAAYASDTEVDQGDEEAPLPPTLTVALGRPALSVREARLVLQGMRPPRLSYEVRVFIGPDRADAGTPIDGNPLHAGTLCFFGHGECTGAPGHCNPKLAPRGVYDRRPEHPLKPRNYQLDITGAVKAWAESAENDTLRLSFVVLDGAGDQVSPEELDFDSITVVAD